MIRYRLKKDLPGVKKGTILTEDYGDDTYGYNSDNGEDCRIRRWNVEMFPDWFELIKEEPKEWEILSMVDREGGKSSDKKNGDRFMWSGDSSPKWYSFNQCIEDGCVIHSVKRIRDGEVFTVGDWCYIPIKGKSKRIVSFYINEGGGMFLNFKEGETLGLNITVATKTKEVFTWDDEKAKEFYTFCYNNVFKQPTYPEEMIERFKQSKTPPFFTKEGW